MKGDAKMCNERSMSVKEAAMLLGKNEQYIRIGLQQGRLPFGTAVKTSSCWDYHISRAKVYDYLGYEYKKEKAPEEPGSSTSANA